MVGCGCRDLPSEQSRIVDDLRQKLKAFLAAV
jgi:hypothetical protein